MFNVYKETSLNFDNNELLYVLNYMLIFIKLYIYICKSNKIEIRSCLWKLKHYLQVEKCIMYANGNQFDFDGDWGTIINRLQF